MDIEKIKRRFCRGMCELPQIAILKNEDKSQYINKLWNAKIYYIELEEELQMCNKLKKDIEQDNIINFDKIMNCCTWQVMALFLCKRIVPNRNCDIETLYESEKVINGIMRLAIKNNAKNIIQLLYCNYSKYLKRQRVMKYMVKFSSYNPKHNVIEMVEFIIGLDDGIQWSGLVRTAININFYNFINLFIDKIEDYQYILEVAAQKESSHIIRKILAKGNLKLRLQNVYEIARQNNNQDIMILLKQYSCYLFPNYWEINNDYDLIYEINHNERMETLFTAVTKNDIASFVKYWDQVTIQVEEQFALCERYLEIASKYDGENTNNYIACLKEFESCDLPALMVKIQETEFNKNKLLTLHHETLVNYLISKIIRSKSHRYQIFLEEVYLPKKDLNVGNKSALLMIGLAFLNNSTLIFDCIKRNAFQEFDIIKLFHDADFY